jgi:hypothetical protein
MPYMESALGALVLPVVRCLALALAQMAHMGLGLAPSDDPVNVCALKPSRTSLTQVKWLLLFPRVVCGVMVSRA